MFQHGLVPVINKPTRITRKSATAIDHIITNSFLNNNIETGIIKSDVSDHFPIFLISKKTDIDSYSENTTIFKRYINESSIKHFQDLLSNMNWENLNNITSPNVAYNSFIQRFIPLYEEAFPPQKN